MKKLYIFDEACPAAHYGIGTFIRQLTIALKETDVQLHVVHLSSAKKQFEIENGNTVTHYYLPCPPASRIATEKINTVYMTSCLYALLSYIPDCSEQLFLLNYYVSPKCVNFMRTWWPRTSLIYVAHFFDPKIETETDEITFLHEVDYIICLSKVTLHSFIEKIGIAPAKIKLIYNGRENAYKSLTTSQRHTLRKSYYIRPDEIVLLFVGRIDMFKGISHLLTAFRKLVDWNDQCHLFIVGDGAWETYAPQCKGTWGRISFTGKLKEEEVMELYRIADIGFLLSYHEQCSYVGIEMMMQGIPTIVSAVAGLDEMFEEGVNTIQKLPVSSDRKKQEAECEAIYAAVKNALQDPARLKEIGENARNTYCRKYSLPVFRDEYLKLFKPVVK